MARVILSEYAAKRLVIGDIYQGVSVTAIEDFDVSALSAEAYVVKVDNGTKKRGKQGLIKIDVKKSAVAEAVEGFLNDGYSRVLVEPYIDHAEEDERYLSLSLKREGIEVLYSEKGGVNIEEDTSSVQTSMVSLHDYFTDVTPDMSGIEASFLKNILDKIKEHHISFLEVNPFIVNGDGYIYLDMAMEVDAAKNHLWPSWLHDHVQVGTEKTSVEQSISSLNQNSTATFSLTVFDKDAAIVTMLSGGGASLVTLDALVQNGLQNHVMNYGEYSGGPSRQETRLYAEELISLLLASKAKKKVLVIAGGVANFTDVKKTLYGIVDACEKYKKELAAQDVLVRVRRGGPGQAEGLRYIKNFFDENNVTSIVTDSSDSLHQIAEDVVEYMK